MLNAEFRWLDPDAEHLRRLMSLSHGNRAPFTWQSMLLNLAWDRLSPMLENARAQWAQPGSRPLALVAANLREQASDAGIQLPQPHCWGWPEHAFQPWLASISQPRTGLLGLFTAEGMWAGCMVGMAQGGVDFLTTPHYLWQNQPELASCQSLHDLSIVAPAVERHFSRPVIGLFIYRNEFETWRDQGWRRDTLNEFARAQTAVLYGF